MGAASYSAAHEAEAARFANRSVAEVLAPWRQEVLVLSQLGGSEYVEYVFHPCLGIVTPRHMLGDGLGVEVGLQIKMLAKFTLRLSCC